MTRYVKTVRGRDGVVRLYLRKAGLPLVALTSPPESAELEAEVKALIAALAPSEATTGTMEAALRDYELRSADFRALAESTKYEYRLILKEFEALLSEIGTLGSGGLDTVG